MNLHVLVLPSWYPKNSTDVNGCFFRDQAVALADAGCKVGVLAPALRSLRNPIKALIGSYCTTHENDRGVHTYRMHAPNITPKVQWLAAHYWRLLGMNLYHQYVRNHGRPDLVHVHSILNAGLVAWDISVYHGVPYVITEHSTAFARGVIKPDLICTAREVSDNARARFSVSTPFSDLLGEVLGPTRGHWDVVPNMVSNVFFDEETSNPKTEEFIFLNVCLLTKKKRIDVLLRAFQRAFKGKDRVKLRIGGDGPERTDLVDLVGRLGISQQVSFLGMLSRLEVAQQLCEANSFVLSSEYETFGVVVIEALAKGKPVVATRCGGPEDIIREGDGILVQKNNVDEMAAAMRSVYTNYDRYNSARISASCRARYSEGAVANKLIDIYRSIIPNSVSR